MSAVIFLGDDFGFVNAIGLVVLIFGAGLFNYSKYQKLIEKDTKLTHSQSKFPTQSPEFVLLRFTFTHMSN